MKRMFLSTALVAALGLSAGTAQAASFTYHGSLQDSGKPAEGSYDIELTLYSASSNGSVIGGPLVMYKVPVHRGSFNTEADFGPLTQSFSQAYVGVRVRNAGKGDYAALTARSQVSAAATTSVCPGAWTLQGNAGNPAGSYLGTADTQPLTFEVNGTQVGQITPSGDSTNAPSAPNVVFGSPTNSASPTIGGATIGGGGDSATNCGAGSRPCANSVQGYFDTVGGGSANVASFSYSTVGGGANNTASGSSTVGGGENNTASFNSNVGGGGNNTASGDNSTVGGGLNNTASGFSATVAGGQANSASGGNSTVCGGNSNAATGAGATIAGGTQNFAGGDFSFAGGYKATVRDAVQAGNSGTCTHGTNCGDYGSFVWEDASTPSTAFTSTNPNQFLIQANGGVAINGTPTANTDELTIYGNGNSNSNVNIHLLPFGAIQGFNVRSTGGSSPSFQITQDGATTPTRFDINGSTGNIGLLGAGTGTNPLTVGIDPTSGNGAFLSPGGVWTAASSRTFKEDFARIDAGSILAKVIALPVQTWFYKDDHQEGRHMGPVAEDFASLFGLGNDDKHIGGVDESGVAFAAIQGLNEKVEAERAQNAQLQGKSEALARENAELRRKLDDVLTRLSKLEAKQGE